MFGGHVDFRRDMRRVSCGRSPGRAGGRSRSKRFPDPIIKEPTDAIIKVTSTNICGSDLHLYEVLGAFMTPGDVLGHEAMGVSRRSAARQAISRSAIEW
jgi:hypothetical protein